MLYFSGILMFTCFKMLYYLLLQCHFVTSFSYWVAVYSFVSKLISLLSYMKKKNNYCLLAVSFLRMAYTFEDCSWKVQHGIKKMYVLLSNSPCNLSVQCQ